jgi:hypothetical protein
MSEPSGSYPEILHQLQRIVARGKEAEKLLHLGDETLPKETLARAASIPYISKNNDIR